MFNRYKNKVLTADSKKQGYKTKSEKPTKEKAHACKNPS
jgi:hypothetical protein